MPYTKFNPRGEREPEQSLIYRSPNHPYLVALQLFGIFMAVRLTMVYTGVMFFYIPLIDPFLAKIASFFNR